jgi:DnaJ-class molecular chaperone
LATLKAKRLKEYFQLQNAYELLSDDNKRAKYYGQARLAQLHQELCN